MKQIMAVFDRDITFANRFATFVNRMTKCPFQVVAFSDRGKLMESLARKKVQLLLTGDAVEEDPADIPAAQVIHLTDGTAGRTDRNCIYKYQSATQIMKHVLTLYADKETQEIELFTGVRCRVTGVYSPVGRCGKTIFSFVLGRVLSEEEKVLVVTLESLSGMAMLLGETYESGLTDLLYYCRQGKLSKLRLDASLYTWGDLDYVPPATYPGDLTEVSIQELVSLIDQVAECGGYEEIIVDIGSFGNGAAELLENCDRILVPVVHDPVSDEKVQQFEVYLKERWGEEHQKTLEKFVLPASAIREQKAEQLLWGEFGDVVRTMVKGAGVWK